jgi:hypothetical protein
MLPSPGTSLCDLFKANQCFVPPQGNPKANCWSPEYKNMGVNLGPQWLRKESCKEFNLPTWMSYDEKNMQSSSCDALVEYLQRSGQKVAMSENWLPMGGTLCQNQFVSVLTMRHPVRRILSHYQHIFNVCLKSNPVESAVCLTMLNDQVWDRGNRTYFNISLTSKSFDIITDNYYMRSLSDQNVYKEPFQMNGRRKEYFQQAKNNLNSFDWIILLDSDADDFDNNMNRDLIVRYGLGLHHDFGFSRKRSEKNSDVSNIDLLQQDYEDLIAINKYDLQLWHEAKMLSNLDVAYINRSMQYYDNTRNQIEHDTDCCGHICPK